MNNTNLTTFTFNTSNIRVVTIDGEPWFVAADVCHVLELDNVSMALSDNCESHQFRLVSKSTLSTTEVSFPNRGANCVSEGGLFALILGSKKPEARTFKAYVCDVILPAIRKDGAYVMGEEKLKTGEMSEDEFVLRAIDILKAKVERYREENARLSEENTAVR